MFGCRRRTQKAKKDKFGQWGAFVLSCKHRWKTAVIWHADSYNGDHVVAHSTNLVEAQTFGKVL